MAKSKASALLDGEDVAGNTPKAPPMSDDAWDRAGEDAKRAKRGEPPMTDEEWEAFLSAIGDPISREERELPENDKVPLEAGWESREETAEREKQERLEAAEKRAREKAAAARASATKNVADRAEKPAGKRKTSAEVKAAADRAEKASDAKRKGSDKLPGAPDRDELKEATKATKARRKRASSEPDEAPSTKAAFSNSVAGEQLLSIVERYERLQEEAATIKDDMKEIMVEAKGNGYDVKVIKRILKTRKMDKDKMDEEDSLFDLYMQALEAAEHHQAINE